MKTARFLFILLAAIVAGCKEDDIPVFDIEQDTNNDIREDDGNDDGKLRVLAIGNSFAEDAVEHFLYELAQAEGKEMIIGCARIGGCDLQRHLDNIKGDISEYSYIKIEDGTTRAAYSVKLSQVLANENWDYISLQQLSDKSGIYSSIEPLGEIMRYVKDHAPDAKIIWHSTWAYPHGNSLSALYGGNQLEMYEAIQDATRLILEDYPDIAFVVPTGTAIQNARTCMGDVFNRDDRHLETTYGRYAAACTWFEALYGIDVTNNSYAPSSVEDDIAALARAAAHAAIANPFSVTDFSGFELI